MPLSKEERQKIAREAVEEAEYKALLANKEWKVYYDPANQECWFVAHPNGLQEKAELTIARLMVQRNEWKRRAIKHGCNPEVGDDDCG